jgi:hypothetical protein
MRTFLAVGLGGVAIAALGVAFVACSSSSNGGGAADASADGTTQDSATGSDGGMDGAHDGPTPDALYGACAIMGSFGSPCHAADSGPDPTDCTDPNYPVCFVGGQGSWCTKMCSGNADCAKVEDAGCVPTQCNGRGFCK